MKSMQELQAQVMEMLRSGPMTCTEVGEMLWGGKRNRQSYARPAGKIISKLKIAGLVKRAYPDGWAKRSPLYARTID